MTKRNFTSGADRGNKLSPDKPRGLRGAHFGPAGPVRHIDPDTLGPIEPPKVSREYTLYANCERRAGRTPKTHYDWMKGQKKRAHAKQPLSEAVRKHRFRPYTPPDDKEGFDAIERQYPQT